MSRATESKSTTSKISEPQSKTVALTARTGEAGTDENGVGCSMLTSKGDQWVLSLGESLTIYDVLKIREAFIANWHGGQSYTVDFDILQEIDTAGIQLLVAMANKVVASEGRWSVKNVSNSTGELLNLYNLEVLNFASSVENTEKC